MVKNAITVFARLKPEKSRKEMVNYKIHRRPKKHSDEDFLVLTAPQKKSFEYIDNRPESWNFSFHRIFNHDVSQNDVFENVARPVVDSVFDGYNATIFAYGQTGSGKTYTITGEPGIHEIRGILPRTLQYVFDIVRKNPENLYSVEVAYLEIYNENGYDLLLERKQREAATRLEDLPRVTIQEDDSGTMHLKNLSFMLVENESEALKHLIDGDSYRAISETPMNPRSSRSHCIFTIVVSVKKFGGDRYRSAKMHLVDLAGSERVYKCAIQGTILNEAKHINLSLHFLEQVIVCLGQENVSHVPYRNSLLTSILRDSLGGNCLTTMLANLSVSNFNLEETISTCRFAQRVALVRNDVNLCFELDTRSENKLLRLENERLRKEIEELRKGHFFDILGSSTGSLEYYKNLVIQRDKEISHLIDLLRKEKASRESVNSETPVKSVEIKSEEKSTQMPSSRVSPRKINKSPSTQSKTKRKYSNSVQGKSQTSPKKSEVVSPRITREIKSLIHSTKSQVPEVPVLGIINDNVYAENVDDISSMKIDRKISHKDNDIREIVKEEIETMDNNELVESQIERNIQTPKDVTLRPCDAKNDDDKSSKKSPAEKTPRFPQNVIKMIRTTRNHRIDNENESSRTSSKSVTPRNTFKAPNILRNILCMEKNSPRESDAIGKREKFSRSKINDDDKIDENFEKSLPLTGDPEIDEEIIAFYRAKRGGGTY